MAPGSLLSVPLRIYYVTTIPLKIDRNDVRHSAYVSGSVVCVLASSC